MLNENVNVILYKSILVYTNVMSAWIYTAPRKPYPLLLRYVSTRRPVLSNSDRLKVMAFIERLSTGPAIGYYCYDLFPMNSKEFVQYLIISGANYLLIISMFLQCIVAIFKLKC